MKKKILYIINHMDWFWSHRLPLALAAKEQGLEVYVAAIGATRDARLKEYGFNGLELPPLSSPLNFFFTIRSIRAHIQDHHIDLLHAITIKYAFMAGLAAKALKVRVIHTIAGLGYLFRGDGAKAAIIRMVIGPALKMALKGQRTTLIFQNPDDRDLMIQRGFATTERSVLIRGSGVDTNAFSFVPEPDNDIPLIVFPTRLVWEKGIQPFVEMARLLKQRGQNARCIIAGGINTTNPNAVTEIQMKELVADNAVEWRGHVTDMPQLLSDSNLVVYPSWYGEGIPKVLLEAAAVGRAIITTDHPGCREVVETGRNGLLVPVRDAAALADAVEQVLKDKDLRLKMGKESRRRAEKEFEVKLIVAETIKLYNEPFHLFDQA